MLNEEKVRYMTGLAIFEKNEGRKIFPINRYFKKDYVGGQMFRSFFGYTFCYLLMLLLWILYKLDVLLGGMSIEELLECGRNWGTPYGGGAGGGGRGGAMWSDCPAFSATSLIFLHKIAVLIPAWQTNNTFMFILPFFLVNFDCVFWVLF